MRGRRRELLFAAVIVPVLAGLALISLRGGASSASTVAPSARPAAAAFVNAYVSFLNARSGAAALPDATPGARTLAASGGRVPVAYRGKVVLSGVRFSGVLGATSASALMIARAGSRTLEAEMSLGYAGGRWAVRALVPPDFDTVFSPPAPRVVVPSAIHAAARTFALAYADYRTGASAHPPGGLSTIEGQIAAHQDPLAATARTGAAARLLRLEVLPEGNVVPVDATVIAGGHRLAFTFFLEQSASGRWQPGSFPVSQS